MLARSTLKSSLNVVRIMTYIKIDSMRDLIFFNQKGSASTSCSTLSICQCQLHKQIEVKTKPLTFVEVVQVSVLYVPDSLSLVSIRYSIISVGIGCASPSTLVYLGLHILF
jgi:hypothetical protein